MATYARLVEIADALRARIAAGPFPGGEAPQSVTCTYVVTADGDEDEQAAGLRAWVVPVGFATPGQATRGAATDDYPVGLIVTQRYDGPAPVPDAWVDSRLRWFQEAVWDVVAEVRALKASWGDYPALAGVVPNEDTGVEIAHEYLSEFKLFWVETTVTYREMRRAS